MQFTKGIIERPQKVVLYGPEGIGKSTFASKFPRPVFIDTEGGTARLDVLRAPAPTDWSALLETIRYFVANPEEFDTLVVDTADWAEKLCISHICETFKKPGIEDFGYGRGYTYLAEEFGKFLALLDEVIGKGMHVIVTAHAMMRKFEQPDELGSYDRWELKLGKKSAPLLREWADTVLFANYETYIVKSKNEMEKSKAQGGKRVMYTTHHPCWDAKNRYGLQDKVSFDFKEITPFIKPKDCHAPEKPLAPDSKSAKLDDFIDLSDMPDIQAEVDKIFPPPEATQMKIEPQEKAVTLEGLLKQYNVHPEEIQSVVAKRGYYPKNTPIANYDPDFVDKVLVGAWDKVYSAITSNPDRLPF